MRSRTYIPQSSVVEVNCTAESSQNPVWSISLPNQTNPLQFTFEASINRLNSQGFHELDAVDSGMVKIIQLLINNTRGETGTVVACDNAALGITIAQTTLVIVCKSQNYIGYVYITILQRKLLVAVSTEFHS